MLVLDAYIVTPIGAKRQASLIPALITDTSRNVECSASFHLRAQETRDSLEIGQEFERRPTLRVEHLLNGGGLAKADLHQKPSFRLKKLRRTVDNALDYRKAAAAVRKRLLRFEIA